MLFRSVFNREEGKEEKLARNRDEEDFFGVFNFCVCVRQCKSIYIYIKKKIKEIKSVRPSRALPFNASQNIPTSILPTKD